MPLPSGEFLELEAARDWNYEMSDWQRETMVNKAMCMAHYLHRTMREAYIQEVSMSKSKGKKEKHGYKTLMGQMGISI